MPNLGCPIVAVFDLRIQEVISLSSQLAYTYSANKKAPCPFEHLLCTSLDGNTPVDRGTIVYLTADSDVELTELTEGETYIIGGIVDHNRYKVCEAPNV